MTQVINVFRIMGLEVLSAEYRIADVLGLDRDQSDYFRSTGPSLRPESHLASAC